MHLLGRGIQRGVIAHQCPVELAPLRHLGNAQAFAGLRDVGVAEIGQKGLVGRQRRLGDRRLGLGAQPVALGRIQGGGQGVDRGEENAVERVGIGQRLDLGGGQFGDQARLGEAVGEAPVHPGDIGLEIGRQVAQALDPGLGLFHVARPRRGGGIGRRGEEAAVVEEGNARLAEGGELDPEAQEVFHHVVGDAVIAVEPGAVDRFQAFEEGRFLRLLAGQRFGRDVRPLAHRLDIALAGPPAGAGLQLEGLEVRDQSGEGLFGGGIGSRCRRRLLGGRGVGRQGALGGTGGQHQDGCAGQDRA